MCAFNITIHFELACYADVGLFKNVEDNAEGK